MDKLLIIDRIQFGFLTDTLKYCEHLSHKYKISYICFDKKYPKTVVKGVNVIYVPYTSVKILNGFLFYFYSILFSIILGGRIFIVYCPNCSFVKRLLFWKKINVDIRTLSVEKDAKVRMQFDEKLKREIQYFDSYSYISHGIKDKLNITNKESFYLPLGSDILSNENKNFSRMNLLYVGTLHNRNIIETVIGVHRFLKENPNIELHYDIIGDGEELDQINHYIYENNLNNVIITHGRKPYSELKPYFDKCNIGVSYVPIEDWFDVQPPTKTYEYILSGLFTIATATRSNKECITKNNGILINDNPLSFAKALSIIQMDKQKYNSRIIRESLIDFQWSKIIKQYFLPIIS